MIHSTAIIETGAKIGKNVIVGPYSCIGKDVEIGDNTIVGPHVVITGKTTIGSGNQIFQFSSIGEAPQDKKYNGEETTLSIGDNNVIREFVTMNRGTAQGATATIVGSNNLFMAYSHVAHDAIIGNNVIFANGSTVAGHVEIGDWVILGGSVSVHQFCKIGAHAFIGGHSGVGQDIPPFVSAMGVLAKPFAINVEGLKRRGFSQAERTQISRAYKAIYRKGLSLDDAKAVLVNMADDSEHVKLMLDFINASSRGLAR